MSIEPNHRRILVIDDNRAIHDDFRKILCPADIANGIEDLEKDLFGYTSKAHKRETYELHSAYQGQEGLELVNRSMETGERYALAFVDMRMPPGWDGVQTIEKIWEVDPEIQIVICTAYSDYSWEDINRKFEAADRLLILKKPYDTVEVCQLARALTQKWRLSKHAHLKLNQLTSMVKEQTQQLEDSNAKLQLEAEQRKVSEERYRLAEEAVNDGLWDWNIPAGKVYYSPRWKSMLGFTDAEIGDSPEEWLVRVHPDDRISVAEHQEEHFQGRCEQLRGECRMLHKDGQYRWILYRGTAVAGGNGAKIRAVGSFTDITDRKLAEEQLRFEAMHDALTGLANRVKLADRLSWCIARKKRELDFHFAVMFIDLDRFKVINDSLGHLIGDKLLVEIACRLKVFVREADTVARHQLDQVARIGGDEFVLVLEDIRHESDILHIAGRLHKEISGTFHIDGHEICTLFSVGIAFGNETYHTAAEILRDADTALYQAKSDGKSCTRIFDPEMHQRAVARWQTETELRRAITDNQLVLHYQPIIDSLGRPLALEALVRWQHPTRGLLPPGEFLPIAEDTDLIIHLGRWVLIEACRQARRWEKLGLPLTISVNVAALQLESPDFVAEVLDTLEHTGVDPRSIVLEITETALMHDSERIAQRLHSLRLAGLRVAIDDFGTGYSSLAYLQQFPVDILKIDRSFVVNATTSAEGRVLLHAMVQLGRALGLETLAEGIEDHSQLDLLRAEGCELGQGFLVARPMEADVAERFLADRVVDDHRGLTGPSGVHAAP